VCDVWREIQRSGIEDYDCVVCVVSEDRYRGLVLKTMTLFCVWCLRKDTEVWYWRLWLCRVCCVWREIQRSGIEDYDCVMCVMSQERYRGLVLKTMTASCVWCLRRDIVVSYWRLWLCRVCSVWGEIQRSDIEDYDCVVCVMSEERYRGLVLKTMTASCVWCLRRDTEVWYWRLRLLRVCDVWGEI